MSRFSMNSHGIATWVPVVWQGEKDSRPKMINYQWKRLSMRTQSRARQLPTQTAESTLALIRFCGRVSKGK